VSANGNRFHVVEGRDRPACAISCTDFRKFWWAWHHQLRALSDAGFRAVAVDMRGYGASDKNRPVVMTATRWRPTSPG